MNGSWITFLSLALYVGALVLVTWWIYRDSAKREAARRAASPHPAREESAAQAPSCGGCARTARSDSR